MSTLWRAAVHEAGHVVADHAYGFCPVHVRINTNGSGVTSARDDWPTEATAREYAVACLAGLACEEVFGVNDETSEVGASGDIAKAREALTLAEGTTIEQCLADARALLLKPDHRAAVEVIARRLAKVLRVSGLELHQLVSSAYGRPESKMYKNRVLGIIKSQQGILSGTILRTAPLSALVTVQRADWVEEKIEAIPLDNDDLFRARQLSKDHADLVFELIEPEQFLMPIRMIEVEAAAVVLHPFDDY